MFEINIIESGSREYDITEYCRKDLTQPYSICKGDSFENMTTLRRRRLFQSRACFISVLLAFVLGIVLGVLIPMSRMSIPLGKIINNNRTENNSIELTTRNQQATIYPVSFIEDREIPVKEVFRNAFHVQKDENSDEIMIVKKLDPNDGSIKEFKIRHINDGFFQKGPEKQLTKSSIRGKIITSIKNRNLSIEQKLQQQYLSDIIEDEIYWGKRVENSLPKGYGPENADTWNNFIQTATVKNLKIGCGRMQNRMIIFNDGSRACARYRQNTDQIQGELFSFYLGQLLNLTNLAPSAASIIDTETKIWSNSIKDIINAQWKSSRPVVLTKWLPNLEPAGIPATFQPLERHLNKFDVWNIINLNENNNTDKNTLLNNQNKINTSIMAKLIELAQWSDLIIFDYLIANLDRVVNNLYNYQWNADIMAAPAHNLAKQIGSQLLVFLDNESGLLHGYRLLKKYEAYHGLLLDNLCIFRRNTIERLQWLRENKIGHQLQEIFEKSTSLKVRDILPPLPEKSIKILNDRIDRVLSQTKKCHALFSNR